MPELDKDVAKRILDAALSAGNALNALVASCDFVDDVTTRSAFRAAVGNAMGTIYTDLMIPITRQHPNLDPDRESEIPVAASINRGSQPKNLLILSDDIDALILAEAGDQWRKVAFIIAMVLKASPDLDNEAVADRISFLVEKGQLESRGDTTEWRHSEVRRIGDPSELLIAR